MLSGLRELEVDLSLTDIFITHMHADHTGLISHLATDTSKVFCSSIDAYKVNHSNDWYDWLVYACRNGFPPLYEAITKHPFFKFCAHKWVNFTFVSEGDTIDAGDYSFQCVAAPGHTAGQICLYETGKKMLVSGDHILAKITPNIQSFEDGENPLQDFLDSLDRISKLDIDLVLPGHRSLITDHRARINELKTHHHNRAQAVMTILRQGTQNACEIAALMEWDLSYKTWDEFPVQQKWFAIGEVIAHLRYLEQKSLVKRARVENQTGYALV
jgi:glyoxylase-like metal-dependent hydrolase (beta-lactamase superfamily II)